MKAEEIIIVACYGVFVLLEVWQTNFFKKPQERSGDRTVEIFSTLVLLLVTQPLVFGGGFLLAPLMAPEQAGMLEAWPVLVVLALFLILDDMSQYWLHRLSHTYPWLYKLHRPHHNAEYLSIRVVYRNNFFYYLLMPGLWLSGALVYLGGGWVYVVYLPIKMAVIFGAHSDVRWDEKLYKIPALSPLTWVLERTISTPSTHSAHHGCYASDGITNYHGNYGNLLFFWDVLFGTAKITRGYPAEYGVENLEETSTAEQLLWPIVQDSPAIAEQGKKAGDAYPPANYLLTVY